MNLLREKRWSPYLAGALIGLLDIFAVYTSKQYIGVSQSYAKTAGMIEKIFAGAHVSGNEYFSAVIGTHVDWQWMLFIGIAAGAFTASQLSGEFKIQAVPQMWAKKFGSNINKRMFVAFVGGALLIFGARLAGGCTSGNGISGTMQLALSSWTAVVFMFVGGITTAALLYRVGR